VNSGDTLLNYRLAVVHEPKYGCNSGDTLLNYYLALFVLGSLDCIHATNRSNSSSRPGSPCDPTGQPPYADVFLR
jgi:hypothetical protein